MKRIILVGPVACGKSTLCQALKNLQKIYRKTQAIEFSEEIIDTPGEYLENRNYYKALIVTAVEADIVLLLQDCADSRHVYPPLFAGMFGQKTVLGVVSKIDAALDDGQISRAEAKLWEAGASEVLKVSSMNGEGIELLRHRLAD